MQKSELSAWAGATCKLIFNQRLADTSFQSTENIIAVRMRYETFPWSTNQWLQPYMKLLETCWMQVWIDRWFLAHSLTSLRSSNSPSIFNWRLQEPLGFHRRFQQLASRGRSNSLSAEQGSTSVIQMIQFQWKDPFWIIPVVFRILLFQQNADNKIVWVFLIRIWQSRFNNQGVNMDKATPTVWCSPPCSSWSKMSSVACKRSQEWGHWVGKMYQWDWDK